MIREAHPVICPSSEARVTARDFNEAMRIQQPAPVVAPPASGGTVNAAQAWHDAISGKAPQFADVIDRKTAAESWLGQFGKMSTEPVHVRDDQSVEGRAVAAATAAQK